MTKKPLILIVDDEPDILDILEVVLSEDYDVIKGTDGNEAVALAKQEKPDLMIMDYKMPHKDGIQACKEIKADLLLRYTPVLILTGKKEIDDKVRGLDAGADDYMVKPFVPEELLARVRMALRRKTRDLDANPLTLLPGNVSIYSEVHKRIQEEKHFAVCYIDLDKFKAYNDTYGFEKGDTVIQETAWLIIRTIGEVGTVNDFIGHIGGDDFVIVTFPEKAEPICKKLIEHFDRKVLSFYDEEARKRGYIVSEDRQGHIQKFPLLSISIGVVTSENRNFSHVGEIAQIGAELKKYAKTLEGSNFVVDQRKD